MKVLVTGGTGDRGVHDRLREAILGRARLGRLTRGRIGSWAQEVGR